MCFYTQQISGKIRVTHFTLQRIIAYLSLRCIETFNQKNIQEKDDRI